MSVAELTDDEIRDFCARWTGGNPGAVHIHARGDDFGTVWCRLTGICSHAVDVFLNDTGRFNIIRGVQTIGTKDDERAWREFLTAHGIQVRPHTEIPNRNELRAWRRFLQEHGIDE